MLVPLACGLFTRACSIATIGDFTQVQWYDFGRIAYIQELTAIGPGPAQIAKGKLGDNSSYTVRNSDKQLRKVANMQWWKQIIEFKPIDLALLVSALGVVIWYFINRHYQKKDSLKTIRLDTYRNFLNKMDEAHSSSRLNLGEIIKVSAETTAAILRDPDNSDETLIEMSNKLSYFTNESMKGWLIYANEINQLTLVCSKEMLALVEEYRDLNKRVSESFSNLLLTLNMLDPTAQQQIQSHISKQDQDRLTLVYNEIKMLMRREIGN